MPRAPRRSWRIWRPRTAGPCSWRTASRNRAGSASCQPEHGLQTKARISLRAEGAVSRLIERRNVQFLRNRAAVIFRVVNPRRQDDRLVTDLLVGNLAE